MPPKSSQLRVRIHAEELDRISLRAWYYGYTASDFVRIAVGLPEGSHSPALTPQLARLITEDTSKIPKVHEEIDKINLGLRTALRRLLPKNKYKKSTKINKILKRLREKHLQVRRELY